MSVHVRVAGEEHLDLADQICEYMRVAAEQRGTGIAKRSPEYVRSKISEGLSYT